MYRKIALFALVVVLTMVTSLPVAPLPTAMLAVAVTPLAIAHAQGFEHETKKTAGVGDQIPPEVVIGVIVGLIMLMLEQGLSPEEIQKRLEAAEQAWNDAMEWFREHYGDEPAGGGGGNELTTSSQDGPER